MADDLGRWWCKHYSGVENGPVCKIGIEYRTIKVDMPGSATAPPENYPCYSRELYNCASREHWSDEEWAEHERKIAERLTMLSDFMARKTETCYHCGQHVVSLRQVGRCVYAQPCGCRMWQGKVPDVWKGAK